MTIENVQPPRAVQPPRVVDVSRPGQELLVEIDVAEAAELLLSLATLNASEDLDTLELGADRIAELRAGVPPELLAAAETLLPGKAASLLLGLVYLTPRPRTASAFLDVVAATDPIELRLHLLGYHMRGHHLAEPETIRRAAEGDAAARSELLDAFSDYVDKCAEFEHVLSLEPEEGKSRLLDVLSGWHEHVLPAIAPDFASLAERDAEGKRELIRGVPPEQVVERVASGIQWAPGPDVDHVVLFPAYSPRPWVYMSEYKRVKIFCPPITADRPQTPADDPADLVRIYKALGDHSRLKLLKRLQAGPISLADAAQEVGLAKSTTHHHLAILRQAGFVLIREGDDTYKLRPDLRPEPGALLQQYLGT
ncbi:MAG: ArsR/SmtB family transcription factor [Gaiellaceae bacterium]